MINYTKRKGKDFVMARHSLKKRKDSLKEKSLHLSKLIDQFLEREITEVSLKEHPEEMDRLKALLEENLWQGNIDPHDPDWQFESDQSIIDVPELGENALHQNEIDTGAKIIASLHGLLKRGFWEKFKEAVLTYNAGQGNNPLLSESFIKADLGQYAQIHASFGDGIHFFSSSLEAIRLLMGLIEGFKPGQFKRCADRGCGKFIFLTTNRKKDYCSVNCAARSGERKKREADRAAFNKYHQEYYKNKRMQGGEAKQK